MDKMQLQAAVRNMSQHVDKLRASGNIPAVLYGHNIQNLHLSVGGGEFEKLFRKAGESTIIELAVADGTKHNVLVQDVQRHYLNGQILHIDFYEVSMTEKLKTTVALEFTGESKAVKELGGTLVKVLDSVEIECLPADLPHSLTVDIGKLATFEDAITVADIPLPKGVTVLSSVEEVVVTVQPPRDVEAELATPIVEDVESVGVVEKEKKEEAAEETEAVKE